jgi:dihydrofolate reductase
VTKMIISIIAAMAENRVIGRDGAIPWDLPEDRRRFRELTMGHPVIMGRRTFESIGHPLPGRKNIVLTNRPGFLAEGCVVVNDLPSAFEACAGSNEVFICGGGELYRETLPLADRLFLTIIHNEAEGDVFFPELPAGEFEETERRTVRGTPSRTYRVLVRRPRPKA